MKVIANSTFTNEQLLAINTGTWISAGTSLAASTIVLGLILALVKVHSSSPCRSARGTPLVGPALSDARIPPRTAQRRGENCCNLTALLRSDETVALVLCISSPPWSTTATFIGTIPFSPRWWWLRGFLTLLCQFTGANEARGSLWRSRAETLGDREGGKKGVPQARIEDAPRQGLLGASYRRTSRPYGPPSPSPHPRHPSTLCRARTKMTRRRNKSSSAFRPHTGASHILMKTTATRRAACRRRRRCSGCLT